MIPAGTVERGERKRTADEVSKFLDDVKTGGWHCLRDQLGDALIRPERHPACRRREARPGFRTERENLISVTPPAFTGRREGTSRERLQPRGREYRRGA
jgi:hypothetical protein